MNFVSRIDRFRKAIHKEQLQGAIVTHLPNIYYLAGFRGSDGALFISNDQAVLLVDGRYGTQAKHQSSHCKIVVYPEKSGGIADLILQSKIEKVGFESRALNVDFFDQLQKKVSKKVEMVALGSWIYQFRRCKELEEIQILEKANRIADDSAKEILEWIRVGVRENEISTELEYRMKKKGAERASFSILVAGGERGALPHAMPTDRELKKNELFFLDFGCTLDGYQTDQTLTIALGKISDEWRKIYQIVKDAHDLAIEQLKPGISAQALDQIARKFIDQAGYGDRFSHSLGHGVGIEVHEYPAVSAKSEAIIEEGMVVTREPGIYLPDQGGVRIEDTLLVTREGSKSLTTVDKQLRTL